MKDGEKNIYKLARTREMKTREVANRLQDKRNEKKKKIYKVAKISECCFKL